MRILLIAALVPFLASQASAEELWAYADKDCSSPAILISGRLIERLDFQCKVLDEKAEAGVSTYQAECQTDAPALETMQIKVTPQGNGTAIIKWGDVDADTYKLCPSSDEPATM